MKLDEKILMVFDVIALDEYAETRKDFRAVAEDYDLQDYKLEKNYIEMKWEYACLTDDLDDNGELDVGSVSGCYEFFVASQGQEHKFFDATYEGDYFDIAHLYDDDDIIDLCEKLIRLKKQEDEE